jgi:hypothetical protein
MRYPSSEKLEIIRLVEQSHLPVKQTLDKLGIPRSTFYRWYDLYQTGGVDALEDKAPMPTRVWNRIPDDIRSQIMDMALWTCPVLVPDTYLIYAATLSNARGLLPPSVECLRRGL